MIELPKDMSINKDKPSILYTIIIALAIYHIIIVTGFAVASFITMDNKFAYISFFDWAEAGRAFYALGLFALFMITFGLMIDRS